MGTGRSSGTLCNGCVGTVLAARQVWFAPAGVRIRQRPARLASRGLAGPRPGRRLAVGYSAAVFSDLVDVARTSSSKAAAMAASRPAMTCW
jgi:hypothetical protein